MGAFLVVELKNQLHYPLEIKVSEKTALSTDWDKSSSSRHSEAEFNSPQPFLKERLISYSIACCATSQAGMHHVVSLTPAYWVKKELEEKKREWENVSAWIATSVLQEDVHWESDCGADRSGQRERGQQSRIDWLLLGDWGQGRRIEDCSVCFLQGSFSNMVKYCTIGRQTEEAQRKKTLGNSSNAVLMPPHSPSLSTIPFVLYSDSSISLAAVQGASPVAKSLFSTTLGHPTTPNKLNSNPKKGVRQRGRKDGWQIQRTCADLGPKFHSVWAREKNKPRIPIFHPFSPIFFHSTPLGDISGKRHKKKRRGMDGRRTFWYNSLNVS